MERTSQKAPKPCFGLEHNRHDPECQACPHFDACLAHSASRVDKVALNKVQFDIVPEPFRKHQYDMDDPELPFLQRTYTDCFSSVFHKNASDNVSRFKAEIASNALKASCSLRMFMLANMVAHEVAEKEVVIHTERARAVPFRAKLLTGDLSVKRAKTYQQLCRDRYGTFSLNSLQVLSNEDKDDLEKSMALSELSAARWIIRYKIHCGTPREESLKALYESEELQLDPEWLALEETYEELVLKPFIEHPSGTQAVQRHRYSVLQVYKHYKHHITSARIAWLTRQSVLPDTVLEVISSFGYDPSDFLYPRDPVRKPMSFWMELSLAIRHNHCWRFLQGEPSYFSPKRNEVLRQRS